MTTADVLPLTWTPEQARARLTDVVAVYKEAFLDVYEPDPEAAARGRTTSVGAHLRRDDAIVKGFEDPDGRLVAVAYGMPSRKGTWWHDTVRAGLPPERRGWLVDAFEVSEVHVRPTYQGRGLGRALMDALVADVRQPTVVLSALADPTLPARRLYASMGFRVLVEPFRFPGAPVVYAILAKALGPVPEQGDTARWWRRG